MAVVLQQQAALREYLVADSYVDYAASPVTTLAQTLWTQNTETYQYMKAAFEFVRDRITHSWDAQDSRVSVSASQCLSYGTGICYAKANLFAALLRIKHIPTGFCYQRLTFGSDVESGYYIHTLNAIHYENAWHRVDVRGNKPGIDAQFNLEEEQLAFMPRKELGEIDYPMVYAHPLAICMNVLESNQDALSMYLHHLPEHL